MWGSAISSRTFLRGLAGLVCAFVLEPSGEARVLLTQDEALRLAFGPGAAIERKTAFLTAEQVAEAKRLSGEEKPPSALVTYYQGSKDGHALGVVLFDTHVVRTQPETLLVLVTPDSRIGRIEVLAFAEPEEYQPRAAWYDKLSGKALDDELSAARGVRPVAGATLTVRATLAAARRVLALARALGVAR